MNTWLKSLFEKKKNEYYQPLVGEAEISGKKDTYVLSPQSRRFSGDGKTNILPGKLTEQEIDSPDFSVEQIDSTAIETYDYNPNDKILKVRFKGGDIDYAYPDVPLSVVQELSAAPSKGEYVNDVVSGYSQPGFRA